MYILATLGVLAIVGALIFGAIVVRDALALVAEQTGNAAGAVQSAVNHLDSLADSSTPAEVERKLAQLDAAFTDLEERTERRYRTISARARRADRAIEDEEAESALPPGLTLQELVAHRGGNGESQPPRMRPRSR